MKFAYITNDGMLHIATKLEYASEKVKKGTIVVPTDIPSEHGYFIVGDKTYMVYSHDVMKVEAESGEVETTPAIKELYDKCLGK